MEQNDINVNILISGEYFDIWKPSKVTSKEFSTGILTVAMLAEIIYSNTIMIIVTIITITIMIIVTIITIIILAMLAGTLALCDLCCRT